MSTYPSHSFPRNWSALDLADAMPLRLSEQLVLGLVEFSAPSAANGPFAVPASGKWHRGYAGSSDLTSFRVR